MAITKAQVWEMYRMFWGMAPIIILPKGATDAPAKDELKNIADAPARKYTGEYGSPFYMNDDLNREVYCPVTIEIDGKKEALDYPVVRLSRKVNMVSTRMVERGGSVNEIVSMDEPDIVVRGFIITHNGSELDDERMNRYAALTGKTMELRSVVTDGALHPDYRVVCKSVKFPERVGVKEVIPYELEFKGDSIFELVK